MENHVLNHVSSCPLTDGTIQKLKQQYDQSGGPALEVTLAEVQEDLKLRPAKIIDNLDEVLLSNGIGNGHVEQGPGSGKTPEPGSGETQSCSPLLASNHWSASLQYRQE